MLHDHDSSICIGEVDVGADLSRSTRSEERRVGKELMGMTSG